MAVSRAAPVLPMSFYIQIKSLHVCYVFGSLYLMISKYS